MVQFAIDPGRTALVIVDMQNCFDGSSTGLLRQVVPRVAAGVINNDAPTTAPRPLMDVRPDDIAVGKPRFGSFYGADLEVILRPRGIDALIVGGTCVCVDTAARESAVREFRVLFLSDGSANFDLPDGGLGPGQRGRAAARRGRRDGVRLRLDRFLRPDAGPDPGSGHGLSSILTAILALAIQEQ